MKKVILSVVGLIGLISMSFTKNNSNKISDVKVSTALDFNKDFNTKEATKLKGTERAIVVGTSATAFPGTLSDSFTIINEGTKEFNSKIDQIISKY
ncbi:MAG: hypothetical protein V4589_10480 [Bacteroidota bacterium]|jgi:hypothetical protein